MEKKSPTDIKGQYYVLVVPAEDLVYDSLTVPKHYKTPKGFIRVLGEATNYGVGGGTGGNKKKTETTIKKLRRLADFLEEMLEL